MGMGKTIQAISLILENPRNDQPTKQQPTLKGKSKKAAQSASAIQGGTLVVCPLVAVMQWKSEIERFVERDHLSIYIHHGPKRSDLVEKIASYDVVLTTYSIIESEVRATLGAMKVSCKYCKRKFLPERLVLHNKYFCGPDAKKTALQDRQQTKKKKGKRAAGEESESEDDLKKPTKKRVDKKPVIEILDDSEDEDVKTSKSAKKGKSPLHQIHWTRIVLDEAHYIKDRKCNTARGVFELKADYRWCLTGNAIGGIS
ncbi:hypothetical protein PINS_up009496 [Pythium insidiosum]|nr:hypothetical protein PINS_up009496 [Pythium insidiosum]